VGAAVGARVPAPSLPVHVTARAARPHRHILMTDLVLHGELWTTHMLLQEPVRARVTAEQTLRCKKAKKASCPRAARLQMEDPCSVPLPEQACLQAPAESDIYDLAALVEESSEACSAGCLSSERLAVAPVVRAWAPAAGQGMRLHCGLSTLHRKMNRASRAPKRRKEPVGSPCRRYRRSPAVPGRLAAARVGLPSNRTSAHFGGRANYRVWATSTGPRARREPCRSRARPPGGSGAREAAGAGVRARRARAAPPQSGALRGQGRRPGPRRPAAGRRPWRRAISMPPGCAHAPMPDARARRRAQATPVLWGEASGCDGLGCELGFGFGEGAGSVPGLDAGSPFPCMASILEKQIAEAEQLFPAPECAPAASARPLPAAMYCGPWEVSPAGAGQARRITTAAGRTAGRRWRLAENTLRGRQPHIFNKRCENMRGGARAFENGSRRQQGTWPRGWHCLAAVQGQALTRRAAQGPLAAGLRRARQPQLHRPDGAGRAGRVRPGAGRARHAGGRGRAGGAPGRARALRHTPRGCARCGPASAPARPPARRPALSCKRRAGTLHSSLIVVVPCLHWNLSLPPAALQGAGRLQGCTAACSGAWLGGPGARRAPWLAWRRGSSLCPGARHAHPDERAARRLGRRAVAGRAAARRGGAAGPGVQRRGGRARALRAAAGVRRMARLRAQRLVRIGPGRQGLSAGVAPVCLRAYLSCLDCRRTACTARALLHWGRLRARRPSGQGRAQVSARQ